MFAAMRFARQSTREDAENSSLIIIIRILCGEYLHGCEDYAHEMRRMYIHEL